jgi:hypothetical protein
MTTDANHTPSRGCYQRGCRAPECVLASYRYSKQLQLDHARGQRRRRDATQVRAHLQRLLANKWWEAEIARAAEITGTTIANLLAGQPTVRTAIALRILSIPAVDISRTELGERQDATGSIRRLQAMAVIGHTWAAVGADAGITPDRIGSIVRGITNGIRPDEARRIAATYRRLSISPGTSRQAATIARNKGWHGPLDWDDIDDPNCQPETWGQSRAKRDSGRVVADLAAVAQLTAAGRSAQQIADELGCHKRTVVRARGRVEMAVAA